MRMRRGCWVAVVLLAVTAFSLSAEALDLVKDGKPRAMIVVADDAGPWQTWAAGWLQSYLRRATGATLSIVKESEAPKGTLISVGRTRLSKQAGIRTDDLQWDGCKLVVKGRVLYLIGRDMKPLATCRSPYNVRAAGAQGTAKAVTTFLEDHVGYRWFIPSPQGTVTPDVRDVSVPDNLNKVWKPAIAYTSYSARYEPAGSIAVTQRIAMLRRGYGGHSWPVHVSEKDYLKDHPEYFRLTEAGKRSGAKGHLCTSNRAVWRIIRDKIRAEFDKGYDVVQLGQSDGWRPCLCPECMKMDSHRSSATITPDNPCNKVWDMHTWIINECRKSHPNKKVMIMIYGPTCWPSKKWDKLPDNVIGEIAPLTPERLAAWKGKVPAITNWIYWWHACTMNSVFVPAVSPEFLQRKLREFREMKVVGMTGSPQFNWGMGGPAYYAFWKLCGDPDLDTDALVRDYCRGVYGKAARPMRRFFSLFHSRSGYTIALKNMRIRNSYNAEDAFTLLYPPKVVNQLDRLLKKAEGMAESERSTGWVKHTRLCFDGLKFVSMMFTTKRAFEANPTRANLMAVKAAVDVFEAWRERVLFYDLAEAKTWFPDHHRFCAALLTEGSNVNYNKYHYSARETYGAIAAIRAGKKRIRGLGIGSTLGARQLRGPITWDFGRMLANLGKPVQEKAVVVKLAKRPPRIDGRLDPAEWKGAAVLRFEPYRSPGGIIKENAFTTVRLLYDTGRLYAGYECVEPKLEKLKLKSVGHDGSVYSNDEVEMFLNPDTESSTKFMQFMASPVKDAYYDARLGFVTDTLDPNYGKRDLRGWNPTWRYAWHIDKPGKRWTLEMAIDFATLGVPPPKPGDTWTGNFARVRRTDGADLFAWCAEAFGNPETFGELRFEDPSGRSAKRSRTAAKRPVKRALELLKNPGFELGAPGQAAGWLIGPYPPKTAGAVRKHVSVTSEKAHGGRRSVKIDFTDVDPSTLPKVAQVVVRQALSPAAVKRLRGRRVALSFWVYYETLGDASREHYYPGPNYVVRAWGADRKPIYKPAPPRVTISHAYLAKSGLGAGLGTRSRWAQVRVEGAISDKAVRMDVQGGVVAQGRRDPKPNRTCVFLDDFKLELLDEPER